MIICLTYYLGDNSNHRYFDSFEEMVKLINGVLVVKGVEYTTFEISVAFGKEEERIRNIIEKQKPKNSEVGR